MKKYHFWDGQLGQIVRYTELLTHTKISDFSLSFWTLLGALLLSAPFVLLLLASSGTHYEAWGIKVLKWKSLNGKAGAPAVMSGSIWTK